jgi:ABC-type dipeptide/oligopeptide/nickel transport system permease component
MLRYIIQRLIFSFIVLFGIITVVFFVARLSPQDPVLALLRMNATARGQVDPADYERMQRQLGLDRPLVVQYFDYVGDLARGDLGVSIVQKDRPVSEILLQGVPVSAKVALFGLGLQVTIGSVVGIYAAANQNRGFDRTSMAIAIWLGAIPQLVIGILLIVVFGVKLGWLPIHGWGGPKHWLLPIVTLTVTGIAAYARFGRAATLEQINQDFARTARAKGLGERRVLFGHVLRNAMIPILTFVGPSLAFILTGNFIVETLFGIPGVAYYSVQSLIKNDYPVMQATVIIWAVAIMVVNLLTDLAYGVIDPRVRISA